SPMMTALEKRFCRMLAHSGIDAFHSHVDRESAVVEMTAAELLLAATKRPGLVVWTGSEKFLCEDARQLSSYWLLPSEEQLSSDPLIQQLTLHLIQCQLQRLLER